MTFQLAPKVIKPAYNLEVSSPGIERELFKLADYERFAEKSAKIKTRQTVENQRNFRGRIVGVSNKSIVFDDKTSGQVMIDCFQQFNLTR